MRGMLDECRFFCLFSEILHAPRSVSLSVFRLLLLLLRLLLVIELLLTASFASLLSRCAGTPPFLFFWLAPFNGSTDSGEVGSEGAGLSGFGSVSGPISRFSSNRGWSPGASPESCGVLGAFAAASGSKTAVVLWAESLSVGAIGSVLLLLTGSLSMSVGNAILPSLRVSAGSLMDDSLS